MVESTAKISQLAVGDMLTSRAKYSVDGKLQDQWASLTSMDGDREEFLLKF
ncbi:hypothetical protein HCH_02744 [Hahella chejuensis KCTC 2396]|uniref:Uncharacterized protein n=1 Tax=Hahella chejuensis (strain KCTC 2396) TaxID=349521 RepID=Q2SIJ5_HAHCH|nr:hypothetical protein HCH_02744 [Hahella chejuensis KCTC 2396]